MMLFRSTVTFRRYGGE